MNTSKKEKTDSQTQRKEIVATKEGGGGGKDWETEISRSNYYI